MYVDPYERFVHKPVERKVPPAPMVPVERVRPVQATPEPEPVRVRTYKPKKRSGNPGQDRRSKWPEIRRLYSANPSMSLSAIGQRVDLNHTSVCYALQTMGIYVLRHDPDVTAKRLEARKAGNISIRKRRIGRRAALIAAGKSGNPYAKLDGERVRAIRHMHSEGFSYSRIARIFHVHSKTVWNVVQGLTWKHVQ